MLQNTGIKPKVSSAYSTLTTVAWLRAVATLAVLYLASLAFIMCLLWRLPTKERLLAVPSEDGEEQQLLLRVPTNFSELRAVRRTLALYQKACPGQIAVLLLTFYLFLQVFMMPGSSFMNVLAGSLYGSATAVPMVALLSTAGSSGSYWLSRLVVKDVVVALFPGRIATFSRALTAQKSQMLAYLVVARLTPVVPSWFINLASPILQVPFRHFLVSTAVGLQPANIMLVHAGSSLTRLHSWRDLYGPRSILLLALCLAAALLPIFVRRRWLHSSLSARLSAEHPPPAAVNDDMLIVVGADSPRGRPLGTRQQSTNGVVSRQHLNGALSGDGPGLQA
ncbi:g5602 [Coccomyxa elongata]